MGSKGITSIQYRGAVFNVASAATAFSNVLFLNQDNALRNDLGSEGRFPANAYGAVLGVVLQQAEVNVQTAAISIFQVAAFHGMHQHMQAELVIGGLTIASLPMWACAGPSLWIQGGTNDVLTVDEFTLYVQNAGYRLDFVPHPVRKYQSVQVRISGTPDAALPTHTGGWNMLCTLITEETRSFEES